MGERQRAGAEAMRAKYARTFDVPLESVGYEEFIDDNDREDARVFCQDDGTLPAWTLGTNTNGG